MDAAIVLAGVVKRLGAGKRVRDTAPLATPRFETLLDRKTGNEQARPRGW